MGDADEARLALEIRDGRPVLLMDGSPLELDEAKRLLDQLKVMIKAAEVLAGRPGRVRGPRSGERAAQPRAQRAPRPVEEPAHGVTEGQTAGDLDRLAS